MTKRVLALAASQRPGSFNRRLIQMVAAQLRKAGLDVAAPDYADFSAPVFDDRKVTESGEMPEGVRRFVAALHEADGIVIAAPEYNWSYPGSLKSLIDWVSCLESCPLRGKYGLLLSASPSRRGGLQGLLHLRVPLEGLGMHLHPAMFPLAGAAEQLGENGLRDSALQQELDALLADYARRLQGWDAGLMPCIA